MSGGGGRRGRASTLGRHNLPPDLIEERKALLFDRQAQDYADWIAHLLRCEPLKPDLLAALRSGVLLLELLAKLFPSRLQSLKPKRGGEIPLYQVHENIEKFLKACGQLGIAEGDIFEPDDLVLEGNRIKVLRTLQCLRKLAEDAAKAEPQEHELAGLALEEDLQPEPASAEPSAPAPSAMARKRSVRLFSGARPGLERRSSKNLLAPPLASPTGERRRNLSESESKPARAPESKTVKEEPEEESEESEEESEEEDSEDSDDGDSGDGSKAAKEDHGSTPAEKGPLQLQEEARMSRSEASPAGEEKAGEQAPERDGAHEKRKDDDGEEGEEEEEEEEEDEDEEDEEEDEYAFEKFDPEFVDPLTPDIMARLLSKEVTFEGEEDYDEEASEEELSESDSEEEEFQDALGSPNVIQEQDELIKTLTSENERLQELLETEIISHHRQSDMAREKVQTLEEHVTELEERATQAEARAREAEATAQGLRKMLEERDKSVSLLSRLAHDREGDLYIANMRIVQLIEKINRIEARVPAVAEEPAAAPPALEPAAQAPEAIEPAVSEVAPPEPKPSKPEPQPERPGPISTSPSGEEAEPSPSQARVISRAGNSKKRTSLLSPLEYLRGMEEASRPTITQKPVIALEESGHHYRLWKQHPDVKPILHEFKEPEIDRQEIIYELIATEISYNRDLDLILRLFINPFRALIGTPKFTKVDFHNIFRNIEGIIKVNHGLLLDLQERNKEQWPHVRKIGDIILKHAPSLEAYAEYCGDQQRSVKEMRRAETDSALVRAHLEQMLQDKECRKLDVYAFMLLPMQRITKYPLLLKSLLKKTDENDPDHQYIKASLAEIDRTVKAINDYTRRRDEIARILTIEKQLDCSLIKMPINLSNSVEKSRSLIREGLLIRLRLKNRGLTAEKSQGRKLERLYLIFFSDMLIITKQHRSTPESPTRFIVQGKPLKYNEIAVRNVPDASNGIGAKNVFLISSQVTGTIVLQASSPEEKSQWVNDFRKADLIVKSKLEAAETEAIPRKSSESALPLPKIDVEAKKPSVQEAEESPRARSSTLPPRSRPRSANVDSESLKVIPVVLSRKQTKREPPSNEKAVPELEEGDREREETHKEEDRKYTWLLGVKKPESFLDITVEQLSEPEFDGWLKVLTRGAFQRPVWKWRYCVLKDFVLYFFLSENHDSRATSLLVLPGHSIHALKDSNKKNVFQVINPTVASNRVLLCGDTPEYMEIWIEALTHATLSRIAPRNFWL